MTAPAPPPREVTVEQQLIDRLEALLKDATPGPWRVDSDPEYKDAAPYICGPKHGYTVVMDEGAMEWGDAWLIAELVTAAPQLLALARRAAESSARPAAEWVSVADAELETGTAYWVIWEGTLQEVPWVWHDGYSEGDPFRGWYAPGDADLIPAEQTELCMVASLPPSPPEGT